MAQQRQCESGMHMTMDLLLLSRNAPEDTMSSVERVSAAGWSDNTSATMTSTRRRMRLSVVSQIVDIMSALALCHNVTPIVEEKDDRGVPLRIEYHASSPDEIALVMFCEECGVTLVARDEEVITLQVAVDGKREEDSVINMEFQILNVIPFSSETKRMGIILRARTDDTIAEIGGEIGGEIMFLAKGADCVMKGMVGGCVEWLDVEVKSMGRGGLHTLVFAKKVPSKEIYNDFRTRYDNALSQITKLV